MPNLYFHIIIYGKTRQFSKPYWKPDIFNQEQLVLSNSSPYISQVSYVAILNPAYEIRAKGKNNFSYVKNDVESKRFLPQTPKRHLHAQNEQ